MKVIELFSGIGAQRFALEQVMPGNEYTACEIDRKAHASYEAIHGPTPNLGDITMVEHLPKCDLLTYSYPCQDCSISNPQAKGMAEGSGTRSALVWEVVRLLRDARERAALPEYLVMENVPAVTSPRHRPVFDALCRALEDLGYTNSWAILNAKDYGVPQSRKRCFMVSALGGRRLVFPEPCPDGRVLRDVLEDEVDEKYYLRPERLEGLMRSTAKQSAKGNGFRFEPTDGSGIAHTVPTRCGSRKTDNFIEVPPKGAAPPTGCVQTATLAGKGHDCIRRVYSPDGMSPTVVTAAGGGHVPKAEVAEGRVRRITPLEAFRLMGFSDEAFARARATGISDTELYKQAGNSIAVPCLAAIFKAMLLDGSWEIPGRQERLD